jgi:hypothetical protein
MHDAGEVKLQSHLPTPNPDLTSELRAAIDDAQRRALVPVGRGRLDE